MLQEAGLEEVRMETASAVIYDKWREKEEGELRRRVDVERVAQRTTKNSWRKLCGELGQNIPPEDTIMEEMTQRQQPPPWREGIPNGVVRTPASKEDPNEVQLRRARGTIEELGERLYHIHRWVRRGWCC